MTTIQEWVEFLAESIGASVPGIRLLISLFMAFPMIFLHRYFLYGKYHTIQHIAFILGGSYIGFFNYGYWLLNAYICICLQYVVLWYTKGNRISVGFSYTFQMLYLLAVYYMAQTETYDINWTIPHCVLTLRLIGQALDVYDGTKDDEDLSAEQKIQALRRFPTFLETAGHVFFPGSFLIGPQFHMRRYMDFVEGKFGKDGQPPKSIAPGFQRFLLGLLYVALFQATIPFFNDKYLLSSAFENLSFWKKMIYIGFYGKIIMYQYVGCWIILEGSCIISGISYNGKNKDGEVQWDGCENIDISLYEKGYKFGHVIASFNKCTNKWIAQNIYKRLKFMGNRKISHFAALLFLAVWHGLHSGYYMCFLMEFIVMNCEKQFEDLVIKIPKVARWHQSTFGLWIDVIICKFFVFIYFGYCMIPFGLRKWEYWMQAYGSVYHNGTVIFVLLTFILPLLSKVIVKKAPKDESDTLSSSSALKEDSNNKNEISEPTSPVENDNKKASVDDNKIQD